MLRSTRRAECCRHHRDEVLDELLTVELGAALPAPAQRPGSIGDRLENEPRDQRQPFESYVLGKWRHALLDDGVDLRAPRPLQRRAHLGREITGILFGELGHDLQATPAAPTALGQL